MTIEERLTALETDVQELKEAYQELAGGVEPILGEIKSCDCNEPEVRQLIAALRTDLDALSASTAKATYTNGELTLSKI